MFSGNEDKRFIPELIIEYLHKNGIDYISSLPNEVNTTINDVIVFCQEQAKKNNMDNVDFENIILKAISLGYDMRYYAKVKETDERSKYHTEFVSTFLEILKQVGITDLGVKKIIVVGIGNGLECKLLFNDVRDISIVDIAPHSLRKAKDVLPQATAYQCLASDLNAFFDCSFDLYVSLRTYMSTYFDIPTSLMEANRVLITGGIIIISVACGYVDNVGKYCYGLYNPYTGLLEESRPDMFAEIIIDNLKMLNFKNIRIKKTFTEIFIFAVKGG